MNEAEIRDRYLTLFSLNRHDPSLRESLQSLAEQASAAGAHNWLAIIQARIARYDCDNDKQDNNLDHAITLLDGVLQQEPKNPHARFLKAAILHTTEASGTLDIITAVDIYESFITDLANATILQDRQVLALAMVNKSGALSGIT